MEKVRDWLNENPLVAVGLTVVAVVVVLYMMLAGGRGGPTIPTHEYFFNLTTQELEAVELGQIPPIQNDQGHELVLAAVFSCGDCSNPDELIIAWLERYTPQGKAEIERIRREVERQAQDGTVGGSIWEEQGDPDQGKEIAIFSEPGQPLRWRSAAMAAGGPDGMPGASPIDLRFQEIREGRDCPNLRRCLPAPRRR